MGQQSVVGKKIDVDSYFSVAHLMTSSAIPLHAHFDYVIGYYFRGRSPCRISPNQYLEFRPGDIGLLNPGEAHEDFSALRRNLAERAIDGVFSERGLSLDWAV
jgi:hypothetical protein